MIGSKRTATKDGFRATSASEYVLIDSNSNQLLYIGSATVTRTSATAPSRGR